MNSEKTTYVVRTEGFANSYGLGEVVSTGVALFRAGKYNLTREQLDQAIKSTNIKQVPRGTQDSTL